jgi:hypothetical protein
VLNTDNSKVPYLSTVWTEEIEKDRISSKKTTNVEIHYSPHETVRYSQLVIDPTKRITNKDKVLVKTISELINIRYLPVLKETKKKELVCS